MTQNENQFSLARVAASTSGRAKNLILISLTRPASCGAACSLRVAILAIFISVNFFCECCLADPLGSWNLVFSNSPVPITSMAYGNGTFIGVGGGLQFVSHDGSNWTASATSPGIDNGGIAFGNGMFLAFGMNNQSRANYVLQSTNGAAWTTIYSPAKTLISAAFGNNTWVFIGTNDILTATLASSSWNWSEFQPSFSPACISYVNGSFLMSAILNYGYSVFSSADGITWQYNSSLPTYSINASALTGIAYGNGVFVTTAGYFLNGDTHSYIFVSSNLVQWTSAKTNLSTWPRLPVTCGGNQFLVSLDTSTYTSSNGYSWTSHLSGQPPYEFNAITFGQGTFVVCNGSIYQSGVFATRSNPPPTTLTISPYPGVTINGTAGLTYQIQCATNLNSTWLTLTDFTLPYSPYIWVDTSSPFVGKKFYQAIQLQ